MDPAVVLMTSHIPMNVNYIDIDAEMELILGSWELSIKALVK